MITLMIDAGWGDTIERTIIEAKVLAGKLDIRVTFRFNGVLMYIREDSNVADKTMEYFTDLKRRS